MADEKAAKVRELIQRKDELEEEIKALYEVLESQGVGMHDKLVDAEDYPRADIDVHAIRIARNHIVCRQNDHKALMKEIEEGLHEVHALARLEKAEGLGISQTQETNTETKFAPFLKVDSLAPGSPAAQAGLCVDDQILRFGSVSKENFSGMQSIATIVQHSKGQPLVVSIKREDKTLNLTLTPNSWSGRGLLGCNIVTIKG